MNENVLKALDVLWKGMVAIFIAIAIIYITILVMNYFTNRKRKDQNNN